MKILTIFLFAFFCLTSTFSQRISFSDDIPKEKVRIILEQLQGGVFSEKFEDIQFLPLISDDVIGKVDEISIIGNRIGFVDQESGHFYIYSVSGDFIKKISSVENYKSKEKKIFQRLSSDGDRFILSNQDHVFTADVNGNVKEITAEYLKRDFDFQINLGNHIYTYLNGFNRSLDNDYALKLDNTSLISYRKKDSIDFHIGTGGELVKVTENKGYASFYNDYRIFELNSTGISKVYDFIFPMVNSIDTNIYYNDFKESPSAYFFEFQDAVIGVEDMFLNGKYLVFRIKKGYDPIWVAYNMETKDLFDLSKILPDKNQDYIDFLMEKKIFSDGEYMYSIIYPTAFRIASAKSKAENHLLSNKFNELAQFNNPVLVKFKFK